MSLRLRERLARLRGLVSRDESPRLADESRWYTEHTALLISTLKWALLGAAAGACVGLGTRVFLSALERSAGWARALTLGRFPTFVLLPVALPLCVWLIRTFSPDARGHGTEAVIAAVHQRSGRVDWLVAPIKLFADQIPERLLDAPRVANLARGLALLNPDVGECTHRSAPKSA